MLPFITCAGNLKVSRFTSDIARSLNLKERKNGLAFDNKKRKDIFPDKEERGECNQKKRKSFYSWIRTEKDTNLIYISCLIVAVNFLTRHHAVAVANRIL